MYDTGVRRKSLTGVRRKSLSPANKKGKKAIQNREEDDEISDFYSKRKASASARWEVTLKRASITGSGGDDSTSERTSPDEEEVITVYLFICKLEEGASGDCSRNW
jgi:hypothetical protein